MKINIIRTLALSVAIISASAAMAQSRSGYFLDNYTYNYQLNPAFGGDRNFISLPAVGNFNAGVSGTLHLSSLIYNVNGRTTTFMNPAVSTSEFLNNIKENNRLGINAKVGILSLGFRGFGGFNTLSVNLNTNINTRIPKAFFSLAKEGISNRTYDITNLGIHADAYAEIALGHSRNINNQWRVGAALKFLVGAGNIDAQFERAQLTLGHDSWSAVTNAKVQANLKGLAYETDINEKSGHRYVSGIDFDSEQLGIGGFGMAIDLGVQYTLNKDWRFSAAVTDLGFINWSNNMVASTNGDKSVETDRYIFNVSDDAENNFSDELDRLADDLSVLYELDDMGDQGSRTRMIAATLSFGAEYSLPVYRKISFGLLNTTRLQGDYTWTEFRLAANFEPARLFALSANAAYGTYGLGFGAIANFKAPGFNLFFGMDHIVSKLAKPGVPLSSNASFSLGINLPF